METKCPLDELHTTHVISNRPPAMDETPGRMSLRPKRRAVREDPSVSQNLFAGSSSDTQDGDTESQWESSSEPRRGNMLDAESAPTADSSVESASPCSNGSNLDVYQTEEEIETRLKELRQRYIESMMHVQRLRRSLGSLSPTDMLVVDPGDIDGAMGMRRSGRKRMIHDDDDDDADDSEDGSSALVTSRRRVSKQTGAYSSKPTSEEIVIDANGYKSYKCLICGRTFTHPPAFSQHKRAHGREAAAASMGST